MAFNKVSAGQPFQPQAVVWNGFIDAANWVQQHLVEFDLALKPYIAGQAERDVISLPQFEEVKIQCEPLPAIYSLHPAPFCHR